MEKKNGEINFSDIYSTQSREKNTGYSSSGVWR